MSKNEPQSLAELDAMFAAVDAMNEADPAGNHASKQTLKAGQAAVNALNARKGGRK